MSSPLVELLRCCPSGNVAHFWGPLTKLEAEHRGRAFEWVIHSCMAVVGSETDKTPCVALGWIRRLLETEPDARTLGSLSERLWYRPRRDFVQTAICRAYGARVQFLCDENIKYLHELNWCLDVLLGGLGPDQSWLLSVDELFEAYLRKGWNDWDLTFPVRFQLPAADECPQVAPSRIADGAGWRSIDAVIETAARQLQANQHGWAAESICLAGRTLRYGAIQWAFSFFGHLRQLGLPSVPQPSAHWLKCFLSLRKSNATITALDEAIDDYCMVRAHDKASASMADMCASVMFLLEGKYEAHIWSLISAVEKVGELAGPTKGQLVEAMASAFHQ